VSGEGEQVAALEGGRPLLPTAGAGVAFTLAIAGGMTDALLRGVTIMSGFERVTVALLGALMIGLTLTWSRRDRGSLLGYWLVQTTSATAMAYLTRGLSSLALLPILAQTVLLAPRWAVSLFGLYVTLVTAATLTRLGFRFGPALHLSLGQLAAAIFVVGFTELALRERRGRQRNGELVTALSEANARLGALAAQSDELATERERARVAREVHDVLGHSLTAVHAQLRGAQALSERDPAQAAALLERARVLTERGLGDVRRSVAALREPGPLRLREELDRLAVLGACMGVRCEVSIADACDGLTSDEVHAITRIAQEGLTNSVRHGGATTLRVSVAIEGADVVLSLRDDGRGAEVMVEGAGITGARERAALLGGALDVRSALGEGVALSARWPARITEPTNSSER
jgi:signal transduction histidine kinase